MLRDCDVRIVFEAFLRDAVRNRDPRYEDKITD